MPNDFGVGDFLTATEKIVPKKVLEYNEDSLRKSKTLRKQEKSFFKHETAKTFSDHSQNVELQKKSVQVNFFETCPFLFRHRTP